MTAISRAAVQQSLGFGRRAVPVSEGLAALARSLWPTKAAHQLAARAGVSHRTVEFWFARDSTPSGEALAELLRSDIGMQVLEGLLGDEKPSWWAAVHRAHSLDKLERQAAEVAAALAALREQPAR